MTSRWSEADIPDQSGRVIMITGANSGIGYEAARGLAEKGAHVVLACRNREKADAAVAMIRAVVSEPSLEVLDVDLGDLISVEAAAKQFLSDHDRLDVLINNAGLMALPQQATAQGFEMQFGVNHLAPFALTGHLLDCILATPQSRIVAISSQGHRPGVINFDDLQSTQRYRPWGAYFQSKLANLLFTYELQRRLTSKGSPTIAVAAHPGGSRTNLGHENAGGIVNTLASAAKPLVDLMMQSAAMGALPTMRAAADLSVRGGDYYGPDRFMEQRGYATKVSSSKRSHNLDTARRLWSTSEELTGVRYPALD